MADLPDALAMLKLLPDVDAFMLEVSRAVSEKPWFCIPRRISPRLHHLPRDVTGECVECEYRGPFDRLLTHECSAPPRLTKSPEWWASKLIRQCDPLEAEKAMSAILKPSSQWAGWWKEYCFATPFQKIAVALVAQDKWRIGPK